MEYRKVGRGGAGNYYSKKDIEDLSKRAAEQKDLEAQKTLGDAQTKSSNSSLPKYASSGRGGAGNVTEASNLASTATDPADVNLSAQSKSGSQPSYHGRGGAGNFAGSNEVANQPQERELQEIKRQDVYSNADSGLQEPEKAHLGAQ